MKYIHLYLTYFLCLITSLIYTGCKDDESELIPNTFEISSSDLNKEIDFRSTTMSIPVKTNLRTSQWSVNSDEKWATAFQQDDKIMLSILDNQGKTKRYAKLAVKSELGNYTINLTQYGVNDVDFRNDTQIAIVSGNAISQGITGASKRHSTESKAHRHKVMDIIIILLGIIRLIHCL